MITFNYLFQIEQLVRLELPCVKQAMVIGEGQSYLAVLLTLHTNVDEKTKQPGKVLTDDAQRWFKHARYFKILIQDNLVFSIFFSIQRYQTT